MAVPGGCAEVPILVGCPEYIIAMQINIPAGGMTKTNGGDALKRV